MERIPLGIPRLDRTIGGGAPRGSVVLLAGEAGAGARECCYTSAVFNGLARGDPEQFDLYYGDLAGTATLPDSVHYVSFTDEPAAIEREMRFVMDDELVEAGAARVDFLDLSTEYFQLTPVPTDWYAEPTGNVTALGERTEQDVIEAFSEYLTEHCRESLVVIDSVTDLIGTTRDELGWDDLILLLKGLVRAAYGWGGVVLLLVHSAALSDRQLGRLKEATDGTLLFEWESGGSERARTLVVEEFRGVLSRLEDENIVRFEAEISDAGFDVSNVRKIR